MTRDKNIAPSLAAFAIAPFATAIYAVSRAGDKWTFFILACFTALFGYCAIPDETMDFYRYLESVSDFSWSDSPSLDIYTYLVTGVVSLFTKNGHVLMAVYGFIYGLLFAYALKLFSAKNTMPRYAHLFFLFLFANAISLKGLGGVRFATASFMLFIGVYNFILTGNKRYWLLICVTPLVHFSFAIYVGLFFFFYVLRKYPKIIIAIFLFSFVLNVSNVGSYISAYLPMFGEDVADRGDYYIDSDLDEMKTTFQGAFWTQVGIIFRICEYIALVLILVHAKRKYGQLNFASTTGLMFLFCLLFGSFGNIFDAVPHLGLRTQNLASSLLILPIFRYCSDNWNLRNIHMQLVSILLLAGGMLKIIIGIRTVTDITPISLVFFPLPFVQFTETTMNVLFGL